MNPDQQSLLTLLHSPHLAPLEMNGSPMAKALGAKLLEVDEALLRVTVSFEPGPVFTQAAGVVQGGAVATMLDFVLAYAALLAVPSGMSVATANLNVAFMRPAPATRLKAVGRVERAGRSLVFTAAELLDAEGCCLASAKAVLPVLPWRVVPNSEAA